MKNIKTIGLILILSLLTLLFTDCGKSEFGVNENTEKRMTITAVNAARDAFFISGLLEAEEGDEIVISAGLTKGTVRVELLAAPEQSMDEFPEIDGTPIITANLSNSDQQAATVPAGSYLVKATCLEKATGSVVIEVKH